MVQSQLNYILCPYKPGLRGVSCITPSQLNKIMIKRSPYQNIQVTGLGWPNRPKAVIIVEIENYAVKKVLVDQGSSVDILYWATYQKLQLPNTAMVPYDEQNLWLLWRTSIHPWLHRPPHHLL